MVSVNLECICVLTGLAHIGQLPVLQMASPPLVVTLVLKVYVKFNTAPVTLEKLADGAMQLYMHAKFKGT